MLFRKNPTKTKTMKTLKIQFFTSSLLVFIISLSSCSKSYVGSLSANEISLAKAEQKDVVLVQKVEIQPVPAEENIIGTATPLVEVPKQEAKKTAKKERIFGQKLKQAKEKSAEKAFAMASPMKTAHKKANNISLKVWGIIMAASGIAAALIIGLWLAPTIGTLAFLWMVLAIAFAFWGFFIAMLGEGYSWENKPRE